MANVRGFSWLRKLEADAKGIALACAILAAVMVIVFLAGRLSHRCL